MQIQNIDRTLLFNVSDDKVMTLEQLQARYGFEPDGTNDYYGINQVNVDNYKSTNTALTDPHRTVIDGLLSSLQASSQDEKTLVMGLEPSQAPSPYNYLTTNIALVRQLAVELNDAQTQARDAGKRLNIIIRFASEMNDPGQVQGNNPAGYQAAFIQARLAFSQVAPNILFSFSPALRADLPEASIGQYWPGDQHVDVIGGTWYIGSPEQRTASIAHMRAYFLHRVGTARPFALSEVGGCSAAGTGNDAALQDMLHEMEQLQLQNVTFKYATIFLASKWGTDAKLAFIKT